jgi:hypothetical protein
MIYDMAQRHKFLPRLKTRLPGLQGTAFNEYFGCVTHTRGTPFPHAGEQAHGVATGDLLQQEFSALPLGGKAGDGPHFDLYACVELLVPHVPDSLDWCRYCFVLKEKRQADLVTDETP